MQQALQYADRATYFLWTHGIITWLCFIALTFAAFMALRSLAHWLDAKRRTEELKQHYGDFGETVKPQKANVFSEDRYKPKM